MQALTLRDGTPALIWPLLPTDDKALQENYQRLSARSKYNRFLSSKPTLSAAMLRLLVDQVDAKNHIALVLVAFPDDGSGASGRDRATDPLHGAAHQSRRRGDRR